MKVIELFNDIANNKKVPNKIKISDYIYYFDINESTYTRFINNDKENPRGLLEDIDLHNAYVWFNLDVEILEDKSKKIKKIKEIDVTIAYLSNKFQEQCLCDISDIQTKINEIVNTLNTLVEKSDKV